MEKYFLSFIETVLPNAAKCAKQMEQLFFTDLNSALSKARLFIEVIVNSVWEMERLPKYTNQNLAEKIHYLYEHGYIEKSIYQSLDVIRRSGNSAVHNPDHNDMSAAYSAHKEMYNLAKWYFEVYTHDERMLPLYELPQVPKTSEELIETKVLAILKNMALTKNKPIEQITSEEKDYAREEAQNQLAYLFEEPADSYLIRELSRLRISSAEAVENANTFSAFKEYLHVKRPIQSKIEEVLEKRAKEQKSNLILLCGSVGDGKSHLLAYLNRNRKDLMEDYLIFNDATESFSPSKTALETLEEILKNFSDQHFEEKKEKVVIAINLGVLNNFVNREHKHFSYNKLKQFIEQSDLFTSKILTHAEEGPFDLISFADYQMFELTPSGVESNYFLSLIQKICVVSDDNPFYLAYKKDLEEGKSTIVHENYKFLFDEYAQKQVVQQVIEVMIRYKHSVSSRHFLNFIADILIPYDYKERTNYNHYDKLAKTLPNLLFNSKGRSQLLDYLYLLNPLHFRTRAADELLVTLNTLSDWNGLIESRLLNEIAKSWVKPLANEVDAINEVFEQLIMHLVSTIYLTDESFVKECTNEVYEKYLDYLYSFNKHQVPKIREFYRLLKAAIFNWRGTPLTDHIYLTRLENDFALVQHLRLNPYLEEIKSPNEVKLPTFKTFITVKYVNQNKSDFAVLDIDYSLFQLLHKVANGYRPNKKNEEDATTFIEFLDKLMEFGNKNEELIFDLIAENKKYRLTIDEFQNQAFVFEKVD